MKQTFFFYDLETSGLKAREDRIMQFAGQRTDAELNPIGEPVNVLVKMSEDALPSPGAIMVTKITPQQTLADGMSEAEFCRFVTEEVFVPGTIALGYNTVRFDDEFMRATFWRNFYDPYEWEWKDDRSRWDMLDVVRLTRALRPEGINWPFTDDGKSTNRLELLTKCNGLSHEHAHDALSDVYATIAVAKLIREKQPKLFDYLFKMREKKQVQKLVNLAEPQPFVYASGRYSSEYEKTTVAVPIAPGRNGNVLVYDLRYDVNEPGFSSTGLGFSEMSYAGRPGEPPYRANLSASSGIYISENPNQSFMPKKSPVRSPVKELCYNKCPAVAPLTVLREEDWERIGLTPGQVEQNYKELFKHPEIIEQIRTEYEDRPEFPPAREPEQALYDGFLDDRDRVKVAAVRNADANKLADFHPDFHDPRLPELLLHYKGRNYPEALAEDEAERWEKYRRERIMRQAQGYLKELGQVKDDFIKEELRLYLESLL